MSGSRVFCSKSSSFLLPSSIVSTQQLIKFNFNFNLFSKPRNFSTTKLRMASEPSSSAAGAAANGGDTASSSHPNNECSTPASSAIDFLTLCHRLKSTKRTGWVRRDVQDPESIADHMYRMGIMALIAADIPGVDRDKCVKMAIVHDIAEESEGRAFFANSREKTLTETMNKKATTATLEVRQELEQQLRKLKLEQDNLIAIVGDITPADGVPKSEKSRMEREALDHMCGLLGGGSRAKEIGELWMEYEENSSPEAKVVKDFDKVEMILQALEYENEQGKDLEEFFQSTAGKFQTEVGKAWAAEVASRRKRKGDN